MTLNYAGHRLVRTTKQIKADEARQRENGGRDERKHELWAGLNQWVGERAGFITTPPGRWPVRLESDPDSELPAKVAQLGYIVIDKGQETRLSPTAGFVVRRCHDICLPTPRR